MIQIKDKKFKPIVPGQELASLVWDFKVDNLNVHLNPLAYVHLLNIYYVFSRPLAKSGDLQKLRKSERQHIFKNATKINVVRKKGDTLKYWYNYVAVFSGSKIYFYPLREYQNIKEIYRYFCRASNNS